MEIKDLIQQHTANIFTVKVQLKITVNHTSTEIRAAAAVDKYYKTLSVREYYTVQYLTGLEIKPVRTVLKLSGIHRLLVSFRAYLMTYNFQTFF